MMLAILFTLSSICFSKEVTVAIASMMQNLENESSIIFGDHVRKGIYLSLIHNKEKLRNKGISIKLDEYNYSSKTESILDTAKKIEKSNAIAVHGYDYSSHALLSESIHKNSKIPVVLPTATTNKLKNSSYYQIAGRNSSQAKAISHYLKSKEAKSVTIISRVNCSYCSDLANQANSILKENKIRTTLIETTDHTTLPKTNDQFVILPMYESEAIKYIKTISKKNKGITYIGGDGWTSKGERYFKQLEGINFNAICLAHWNFDIKTKLSDKFKNDYKSSFGNHPSDVAALSYDSMNFIIKGIINSNKLTRFSLNKSLKRIQKYQALTGTLDTVKNEKNGFTYLKWEEDKFRITNEI